LKETGGARTQAWAVVALGFLALALAFSARAALGLGMPIWERELGWTRGFVSFGGAVALIVMACVAPFAGNLVDRRGPRLLLVGGMLAVGAGMLLIATGSSRWLFLLAYGGISALGFGTVATHVVATAIAGRFDSERGLATGIGTAGATAGQLVIVPLLALLLQNGSWRLSFEALGGACLLLAPIAAMMLAPAVRSTDNRHEVQRDPLLERLRYLVRSRALHLLFWSFLLCGFTTTGVIETHLLPYAAACGFAPLPSAEAYGILSGVNLVGMIASGWLTDRMNRAHLLGIIYFARGLCFILLMLVAGDIRILLLFAVLFGAFDYSTVPPTASLVARHLGFRIMGLAMGLISAGHALGGAAGAYLGGWLFDHLASYEWVWIASLGLAATAGLLALSLNDGRTPPGEPAFAAAR